jgi:predicted ATP-grasp superfamily ATP-dependent carboligase
MDAPPVRVLVAGVSTRAVAESAARASFDVTAIDAFGDADQHAAVHALALGRDFGLRFSANAAARASRGVPCDAVAYLSSFENHPHAVRSLAAGRELWGNAPAVLRRVRDPLTLARVLAARGFAVPGVRAAPPDVATAEGARWLAKPRASGGGHRVRPWRAASRLPRGAYLQEHIEGTPGAVVFVAASGDAVPLGVVRQLIGERAFGSAGYRYCGSILAAADDPHLDRDGALVDRACSLVRAVAHEFGLVGVNGVDFIARDGVPYPIEVNPRWTASMELVERAYGLSMFGAHAAACTRGALPRFDVARARRGARAVGKAVVFASHDVAVGDTRPWLVDATVRDVPQPGERIPRGRPVCTVFAEGRDAADCQAALERRAAGIHGACAAWAREAA